MRLNRFIGVMLAVAVGSLFTLYVYTRFFNKQQTVYVPQYANAKYTSFTGDSNAGPTDFTYAAELTVHAVVHVTTKSKIETEYINPFEFFFGDPNGQRSMPMMGFGSGVIIQADGYIVTNYHVIKGADDIMVKLNDRREFKAKVVGYDPSTDIALLKVDGTELPTIPFGNSDDLRLGQWVLAVGNPFNLTSSVTAGIVSAKGRNLNIVNDNYSIESFIQTDAALNPGNSGGALVNTKGELIGINTAIISPSGAYSGNSFSIPSSIVKKVVNDLQEFGTVQRAFLGVNITDVTAEIAKKNNFDKVTGVYVNGIKADGAAKEAGINEGDVIIGVNDIKVNNTAELQEQIGKYRPKDKVTITLVRKNEEKKIDVILRNSQGTTILVKDVDSVSVMGAKFAELSDAERQQLGIKNGVKITELSSGKFKNAGIEKGFIIIRMNNKNINSVSDIRRLIEGIKGGVLIEGVYPNGVMAYYAFGL
jgi:Do/DeqQ family serine protease